MHELFPYASHIAFTTLSGLIYVLLGLIDRTYVLKQNLNGGDFHWSLHFDIQMIKRTHTELLPFALKRKYLLLSNYYVNKEESDHDQKHFSNYLAYQFNRVVLRYPLNCE